MSDLDMTRVLALPTERLVAIQDAIGSELAKRDRRRTAASKIRRRVDKHGAYVGHEALNVPGVRTTRMFARLHIGMRHPGDDEPKCLGLVDNGVDNLWLRALPPHINVEAVVAKCQIRIASVEQDEPSEFYAPCFGIGEVDVYLYTLEVEVEHGASLAALARSFRFIDLASTYGYDHAFIVDDEVMVQFCAGEDPHVFVLASHFKERLEEGICIVTSRTERRVNGDAAVRRKRSREPRTPIADDDGREASKKPKVAERRSSADGL
jgi:hypothetical protein